MVTYSALNVDTAEIGLLELLPGKEAAPIHGTLRIVSVHNNLTFEALFYVWGDATVTMPMLVDGDAFHVTTNLEEGLRALRYRRKSRVLWVDAICINQHDVTEKNVHVPRIGTIYSEANRVVAWLGSSNPAMELAVSYAKTYF